MNIYEPCLGSKPFLTSWEKLNRDIEKIEDNDAIEPKERAEKILDLLLKTQSIPIPDPKNDLEQLIANLLRIKPEERFTARQALQFFQEKMGSF
jgi:serine/threonine protein kinase